MLSRTGQRADTYAVPEPHLYQTELLASCTCRMLSKRTPPRCSELLAGVENPSDAVMTNPSEQHCMSAKQLVVVAEMPAQRMLLAEIQLVERMRRCGHLAGRMYAAIRAVDQNDVASLRKAKNRTLQMPARGVFE